MKTQVKTRYIGNVEKWTQFWQEIVDQQLLNGFFGAENAPLLSSQISDILANICKNKQFYQDKIAQYPFMLQPSFKDMWLSGTVDIFDIIFRFFKGYTEKFQPKDGLYYGNMFLNPQHSYRFEQLYQNTNLLASFTGLDQDILDMMFERQEDGFSEHVNLDDFYEYPNDEYVNPIATTIDSLNKLYLVLDGELEVDGSALFVFADQGFADDEYEVGLLSYSEATWKRYPSLPEPFLFALAYLLFEREVHGVDDLLMEDLFKQLYE